jgi:hypothetical protein
MSVDESAPTKLSDKAEALLANWELVDRDWEASAAVIETKLADITPGSTDAALLEAPLPREADEGEIVTGAPVSAPAPIAETSLPIAPVPVMEIAQSDAPPAEAPVAEAAAAEAAAADAPAADAPAPEAPAPEAPAADAPAVETVPTPAVAPAATAKPQSLADMARASMSRAKASQDTADIAKETLAVASMRRGPSAEVVERVQAAGARKSMSSAPTIEISDAPRTSGVIARVSKKSEAKGKPNMAPIYGAGVALVGIAAAIALLVRGGGSPEQQAATQAEPPAMEAVAPPASPAPPAAAVAQPDTVAQAPVAAPEPAPVEATPVAKGGAESPAPVAKKSGAAAGAPAAALAPPSSAAGPAPEKIVLEEDGPTAPGAPSGKTEPPMRPADGAGSIPQKPSIGAVSAAIGAVMGGARNCLAGQKDVSLAQVVFSSDGTVQSVAVNGPAAGTAAAACIQGALRKARLQPFAVPTFSTGVTIRPP